MSHPIMMIAVIATFFRCGMPPLNIYHTTLFRELPAHIKSHTVMRQNMIILAHFDIIALVSSFVVCYNYFSFRCFFFMCVIGYYYWIEGQETFL